MFRLSISRLGRAIQIQSGSARKAFAVQQCRLMSNELSTDPHADISHEEHTASYVKRLQAPDLDGEIIRNCMTWLNQQDVIPEPVIVIEALKACRKVNDIALAIRIQEQIKWATQINKEIDAYMDQEIKPTLEELGIPTLKELGYDKP